MTLNQEAIEFVRLVARMKTEDDYGGVGEGPPSEDWISTLSELIVSARALGKKHDKEAKEQKRLARYKQAAIAGYYENDRDGGLDFDDEPTVSKGSDPGAYVSCWAWVADIDVKQWRKDNKEPRPKTKSQIIREAAQEQGIPVIEIPLVADEPVTDEERSNGPKRG